MKRQNPDMADGLAPTTNHIESEEVWYIIKNPKASIYLQGTTYLVPTTYKKNMFSPPSFQVIWFPRSSLDSI